MIQIMNWNCKIHDKQLRFTYIVNKVIKKTYSLLMIMINNNKLKSENILTRMKRIKNINR